MRNIKINNNLDIIRKINIKSKTFENLSSALIILFIFLLIINIQTFDRGIHNVDSYQNVLYVEKELIKRECYKEDPNFPVFTDTANDFIERPIREYYIVGMNQINKSYIQTLITIFILGFLIRGKIDGNNK